MEERTDAECEELFKASRTYSDEAFIWQERKDSKDEEFAYRIQKTYKEAGVDVSKDEAKKFEERYRYYQKHIHLPDEIKEILTICKQQGKTMGI